ncbi:MAG: biotin--[acetyl-CoA-carboxylase] ligase [Candidatus Omnitrophota bacterium]
MLDDKILYYFKKHQEGHVSGEDLSHSMGISRAAVWKHIERLRDEGYDIEATPHLGYRLVSVPDRLTAVELSWQLKTGTIGRKIYSYEEVESTNGVAYDLAMQGEKEGSVVISESQRSGRGRMGRKWISPKGKGAYFSAIVRPDILPNEVSSITLISALSVAKTIREETNLAAFIKWPNDILIGPRKVCGILTEMNAEADKINFVIIGVGININTKKELLPDSATSLSAELGGDVRRLDFVKSLFRRMDGYYAVFRNGGIDDIISEYKSFAGFFGKRLQVSYHDSKIEGYAIDVDKEGALILRMDSGLNEKVMAGDVVMLR